MDNLRRVGITFRAPPSFLSAIPSKSTSCQQQPDRIAPGPAPLDRHRQLKGGDERISAPIHSSTAHGKHVDNRRGWYAGFQPLIPRLGRPAIRPFKAPPQALVVTRTDNAKEYGPAAPVAGNPHIRSPYDYDKHDIMMEKMRCITTDN